MTIQKIGRKEKIVTYYLKGFWSYFSPRYFHSHETFDVICARQNKTIGTGTTMSEAINNCISALSKADKPI